MKVGEGMEVEMATKKCGVVGISESGRTIYLCAGKMKTKTVRLNKQSDRIFISSNTLRASLTKSGKATSVSRIYRIFDELFSVVGGRMLP